MKLSFQNNKDTRTLKTSQHRIADILDWEKRLMPTTTVCSSKKVLCFVKKIEIHAPATKKPGEVQGEEQSSVQTTQIHVKWRHHLKKR